MIIMIIMMIIIIIIIIVVIYFDLSDNDYDFKTGDKLALKESVVRKMFETY